MNTDQTQRLLELIEQAMDLEPTAWAAFAAAHCGGDSELEKALLGSLRADTSSLSSPLVVKHRSPGDLVGPYRILEEIGEGGMGIVYLAELQNASYQRQVALKILKRGMDSAAILRCFHNERQILASLNHPNIATLYDGGTSDDGLPYFAMEYVVGEPLTEYCNKRNMDIDARLNVFKKVCHVIAFAHQHLVIHRDLKPQNILVTPEGEPMLLDFGIAKICSGEDIEPQTVTTLGMMTPDYASPEQLLGQRVTTLSDVYALGIILYQLLTGTRPFHAKTPAKLPHLVRLRHPVRPSRVAGQTGSATASKAERERAFAKHASCCGLSAPRLRHILAGDLDNMIMMCLHIDPEKRYNSPVQLAEDIERLLNGHPVIARKTTWLYQSVKWLRRHHVMLAVVVLLALSVAMLGAFALQRHRDALHQTERAEDLQRLLDHMGFVAEPQDPLWQPLPDSPTKISGDKLSGALLQLEERLLYALNGQVALALSATQSEVKQHSFGPGALLAVWQELAVLLAYSSHPQAALNALAKARPYLESLDQAQAGQFYFVEARLLFLAGQFSSAEKALQTVLVHSGQTNRTTSHYDVSLQLLAAKVALAQGAQGLAEHHLKTMLAQSDIGQFPRHYRWATIQLAQLYAAKQRDNKARFYLQLHLDSLAKKPRAGVAWLQPLRLLCALDQRQGDDGRVASHKRLLNLLQRGRPLPEERLWAFPD